MRNTRRLLGLLMIGFLALLSACSSPPTPPPPPVEPPAETHELTKTDLDAWLDGTLPDVLTKGKATGAVVTVVKDGQILTNRGYGNEKLGDNGQPDTPVNPETTIFRWGSISKVPTAIAVMQLVEQGKLDLDADITTYTDVPIQKHHSDPITLRHLLTHTAGFEESLVHLSPALKDASVAEYVHHNPPVSVYRPGTTPGYSNYGITLAGYLVEQASGQPFHEYVKEHVLSPAGMTTASYDQPLPEETLALAYENDGQPAPFQFLSGVAPAGTLAGSGKDAAAFMLAQLNRSPQLLTKDGWEQMWAPALTEGTLGNLAHSPRMGLGYFTGAHNGHRTVSHGGDTSHYHSQFEIYPDNQTGIFISFTGRLNPENATLRHDLTEGFADRYLPADTTTPTPPLEGSAERAQQVAGSYTQSRGVVTTWMSAWSSTLHQEKIQALPNGNLLFRDRELVEIAPWIWKDPRADGLFTILTARVVDGKVEAVGEGPAFTLLPATPTQQTLVPICIVSLAIFSLALLTWAIGAIKRLVQRRRGHPITGLPRLAHLARLGALSAAVALPSWLIIPTTALSSGDFGTLGNIPLLRTLQILQWAGIAAIIPAGIDLVATLRTRAGWRRTTMAALLLAALLATAWWAWTGNTLNPNLGV
ncbi:MAG: serine hydrolase domain-containing protein [Arachnia propionica]|uniref:serine hydrolase domain-containing protein n=1 Tax=Arachnia propionica TaxID=1750 RepID=UPI0026FEA43B|nr:serine hydrolase domain-containing protein [Arachnia propionica]